MSLPIHAIIISWDGHFEQAKAIAKGLSGSVDRLSVIYSNGEDTPEAGDGDWVQVPQSWYFGRKFRKSLDLVDPGEVMLQIQADAHSDDWPSVAERCRRSIINHDDIGIWSPDINWTPWPSEVVAQGMYGDTQLELVRQTDGIIWALHPDLIPHLRALDYSSNNLGWGIDWVALYKTHALGKIAVRDLACPVSHPKARGYHNAEAAQHMKNFLAQLPTHEQTDIVALHHELEARKMAIAAKPQSLVADLENRSHNPLEFLPVPQPFLESKSDVLVAEASVVAGNVYVKAAGKNVEAKVGVEIGDQHIPLRRLLESPPADLIVRSFPLEAKSSDAVYQKLNDLEEWQVDGWPTLRIIPDFGKRTQDITLAGSLTIEPSDGPQVFQAQLAAHRTKGDLVITLADADGHVVQQLRRSFDKTSVGGNQPQQFQPVEIHLPQVKQTVHLGMRIESKETPESSVERPAIFFVAQPRLRAASNMTLKPAMVVSKDPISNAVWYHGVIGTKCDQDRSTINLVVGKDKFLLLSIPEVNVRLLNDWGHVVDFSCDQSLAATVWINGAACFPIDLTPDYNGISIPAKYLTGLHAFLELRDASGTITFWSNWIVPRRQVTSIETLYAETRGPYPSDLFAQSPARFEALRNHLAHGADAKLLPQLSLAVEALEAGYDNLKRKPLSFPKLKKPDVSIVIPAHNKINVTYACLAALLLAWNKASFEVILVDDASTDETAEIEELVSGITVIHNVEAQRFIRACNAGAAKAKGRYVVLLNNDTEPTTGWLDALIDAFDRFPNVGLAGSKLLYPDGSLQDAGGIIWNSGDPWNYGNRQNPHEPRFNYARQVDYLSGAAMMTTKDIWDDLGGLSAYLEPMYFEDTDFAFKVRDSGYTTWYVPSSVVYHSEGMTSGTDISSGFKKYQEINRPKFKRQWARAFKNFSKTGTTPDLEKDRGITGRVLFIDYTTPMPDQSAGSYAALQEIKLVQSLGYKVTFLPENMAYMGHYTTDLEKMGVEVITAPFYFSMDAFLEARGSEFDAFYITRYHVVNATAPKIRAVNPQARIIMNNADLHYLRMLRKAVAENDESQKETARLVQKQEFAAMRSVDVMLSYNDREHTVIEAQSEGAVNVMTCPWVLDCSETVPPRDGRTGLSFLGGFQHHPNVEGVEWFVKNVMSRLEREGSDLKLSIYGSRMGENIENLAGPLVDPVGFVDKLSDAFDKHLIFVAPLLSGAGIKGKVLSALASGIPCVLSPTAAEGIGLRHGRECLIAETSEEWVDALNQLQNDAKLWQLLSDNARYLAQTQFSFENGRKLMRAAFESADLFGSLD